MANPKTQSKIPIYPRPVSPLNAEPLPITKDVICYYESSDSDLDATLRAGKKRRIEKLGEQYLRGDGLYIMTAGLKGAFNSGWRNPWAEKKQKKKTATENVEPTKRLLVPEVPETSQQIKKYRRECTPRTQVDPDTRIGEVSRLRSKNGGAVQDDRSWLKINLMGMEQLSFQSETTPTRVAGKSTMPRRSAISNVPTAQCRHSFAVAAEDTGSRELSVHLMDARSNEKTTPNVASSIQQQIDSSKAAAEASPTSIVVPEPRKEVDCPASIKIQVEDAKRIEKDAEPSAHASREGSEHNNMMVESKSDARHAPSTQTSTSNQLPSAQIVSAGPGILAELVQSASDEMIEPVTQVDVTAVPGPAPHNPEDKARELTDQRQSQSTTSCNLVRKQKIRYSMLLSRTPLPCNNNGILPFSAFRSPNMPDVAERSLDTEDNCLDSFEATQQSFHNKSKLETTKQSTITVEISSIQKTKKRASFAAGHRGDRPLSGSSQSSLKSCLRVSKSTGLVHQSRTSCEPKQIEVSPYGRLGLNMETSSEETSAKENNRRSPSHIVPIEHDDKTFVRNKTPVVLTTSTDVSVGISGLQDAQWVSAHNRKESAQDTAGHGNFNLSSAMDELGTFLGSWDAEKEAKQITTAWAATTPRERGLRSGLRSSVKR